MLRGRVSAPRWLHPVLSTAKPNPCGDAGGLQEAGASPSLLPPARHFPARRQPPARISLSLPRHFPASDVATREEAVASEALRLDPEPRRGLQRFAAAPEPAAIGSPVGDAGGCVFLEFLPFFSLPFLAAFLSAGRK